MKKEMAIYYLGALLLVLSAAVFLEEPLHSQWSGNPDALNSLIILYGFPVALGLGLFFTRRTHFETDKDRLMVFSHAASVVGILWLILWCFVWLARMMNMGGNAEMYIKHTAYLHLFGVGFAMAGYSAGWLSRGKGARSTRFLMSAGWAACYMALFNLYLQPALKWMWATVLGGSLLVLGAFLIARRLKRAVVAASTVP
jgi:hypothetical protein